MSKTKLNNEDRFDFYLNYIKKMQEEGYSVNAIGEELAIISHVLLYINESD